MFKFCFLEICCKKTWMLKYPKPAEIKLAIWRYHGNQQQPVTVKMSITVTGHAKFWQPKQIFPRFLKYFNMLSFCWNKDKCSVICPFIFKKDIFCYELRWTVRTCDFSEILDVFFFVCLCCYANVEKFLYLC